MKPPRLAKFLLALVLLSILIAAGTILFPHIIPVSSKNIRNVVLISIDTCRADYLSCYGYPRQTTPNIDRLAAEGTLFTNVISPVPITLPAHSSMMTGTIPPYHGVHDNVDSKLAQSHQTLAEILKSNGFTTAAFVSAFVLDSQFALDQGFDTYNDRFERIHRNVFGNERRAAETSSLAGQWLQENKDERFFLFLHYYDPHDEYEPPEPFASRFANNLYAGEIAYTDHCIAQVFQKLKDLGLYDTTLIIVAGDHGEMLGEHGEKTHTYFIYQGAIKVPLIFKLPGQTRRQRIDQIVGLVDILPTVCSILDIQIPPHVQGKDLSLSLEQNGLPPEDRYIYCESLVPTVYNANFLLGLVTSRLKYIQTSRPELYDLINDPSETANLIHQQPRQARILKDRLKQTLEQTSPNAHTENSLQPDMQTLKRLESLGYVAGKMNKELEFDQTKEDPKDLVDFHNDFQQVLKLNFQKNYTQAEELCRKLISQRPQTYKLLVILAAIATEKNDFNAAIAYLYEALKLEPEEYEVHYNLGRALTEMGRFEEATEHFKDAIRLRPADQRSLTELGVALYRQGKFEEAIKYHTEALAVNPNLPEAYNNLGLALFAQEKLQQAVLNLNKALQLEPEMAEAHQNLARVLVRQGRLQEAVEHYKKSLQINPEQPMVHNELAALYYNQKNFDQAATHLNELLRLNPNQPGALNDLAIIYSYQGRTAEAFNCWIRALQIKPNWPVVIDNIAWVKATHEDPQFRNPDEAVELAKRACELTNYNQPQFLNTLATAYAAAGQFSQATQTAQKALDLALSNKQETMAKEIQNRLEFYKRGLPYYSPKHGTK